MQQSTHVTEPYRPKHHVRIVTAASLFDGHDAAINIMRRILQSSGAEVIHLGHNRSVQEIVDCAIQEDAQGICITSYQGGHVEYLKYMHDLLEERGAGIKIFAGGGGTILPTRSRNCTPTASTRIYSPDDGRAMGLQGMINDVLRAVRLPDEGSRSLGDELGRWRRARAGRSRSLDLGRRELPKETKEDPNSSGAVPRNRRPHDSRARHHRHRRRGQVVARSTNWCAAS